MTYRQIIENFDRSRLPMFLAPVKNNYGYVTIEHDNEFLKLYCNDAGTDSAAIRAIHPICGIWEIWIKFRVISCEQDSHIFLLYDSTQVPKPDADTNLKLTSKISFIWNSNISPNIGISYYDPVTHNPVTIASSTTELNKWYIAKILKNKTEFSVDIYNGDFTSLIFAAKVNQTLVHEGPNSDFITIGTFENTQQRINADISKIILTYDPNANNYSNSLYHSNSKIVG